MPKIHWLEPSDPADSFPDPDDALLEPDGLLAIGGDLSVDRLLVAYRHGIFPWYQDEQPILWWCPATRAILFPSDLHISRSLRKTIRQDRFQFSFDQAFDAVVDGCADMRSATGTWITPEMSAAYKALHQAGHAHSVEIWHANELAGGVYGISIGAMFFGESMFSAVPNASKLALFCLAACSVELGIKLIDCQLPSAHLTSLGSRQVPRRTFLDLLKRYTALGSRTNWSRRPDLPSRLLPE